MFGLVLSCHASLSAAEIYSNATGGGLWSDAATWKGGTVPGPEDDVVIARDDVVTFDRNDDKKISCKQLNMDPRSLLQFKQGGGFLAMVVDGPIESYGTIKIDATKVATDKFELRLVAAEAERRTMKVPKGGGLIIAGRPMAKGKFNAFLRSLPPVPEKKEPPFDPSTVLEIISGTFDLQRCELENIYAQGLSIDNTGAKAGERCNIVRSHFIGTSRLLLTSADTFLVADNVFERDAQPALVQAAMYFNSCPLGEVRGNTVRGTYAGGITFYGGSENAITNNLIEKCASGFYWYGANAMVRKMHIRDCGHALTMTSASGALEDVLIERCTSGYYHGGATVQMTNLVFKDMQPPHSYDIHCSTGPLTLVNCDIKPEQIQFAAPPTPPPADKPQLPTVQSLSFLVVQAKGEYPAGMQVELKTANPAKAIAPGAADPNVRNSPAAILSSGFTPLPKTLEPLIVRGWFYDAAGKPQPAPQYYLNILGPAGSAGTERKILKSITVTPAPHWYRPEPNDKKPTIEVTLP